MYRYITSTIAKLESGIIHIVNSNYLTPTMPSFDESNTIESYINQKQLCITTKHIFENAVRKNHQGDTTDDNDFDDDAMLHSLSEQCFLITDGDVTKLHSNPTMWLQRKESNFLLSFRFCVRGEEDDNDRTTSSSTLLSMFSSMKISSSSSSSSSSMPLLSNEINNSILKIAAVFVVHQIINNSKNGTLSLQQGKMNHNNIDAMNANTNKSTKSSASGSGSSSIFFGLSKKMLHKASNAVTSVLASYDLAENPDPYTYNEKNHDIYDDYDDDKEDDDAYKTFENHDQYQEVDDDDDDARISMKNHNHQKQKGISSSSNNSSKNNKNVLCHGDLIWNVHLLIDCWILLTKYIKCYIQTMKDENIVDECDQLISLSYDTNSPTITATTGIILKRWGDENDKNSFLSFCHKAGRKEGSFNDNNNNTTENSIPSLYYQNYRNGIANILTNLTIGTSLDLLLMILIETSHAILSSDQDLVILCNNPGSSMYNINSNISTEPSTNLIINEVDIAIFKLSSTIQSIEARMENLSIKAQTIQQQALSSKRNGNTKTALMHMKRRQLLVQEIDRCSSSILNLESGLHSLKRARSDVQVVKAYEMINETMKSIRCDGDSSSSSTKGDDRILSMSHVEEVMEDFHNGLDDLEDVQESLSLSVVGNHNMIDEDELEKELLALGGNSDDDHNNDNANDKRAHESGVKIDSIKPEGKDVADELHQTVSNDVQSKDKKVLQG